MDASAEQGRAMVEMGEPTARERRQLPLAQRHRRSRRQVIWGRTRRSYHAIVGIAILAALSGLAILAPVVAPGDPEAMILSDQFLPPSREHPFGTDEFGRDILSRVLYGARISLRVGILAEGFSALCGIAVGLAAGYYGRWFDVVSQRVIDVMLAFPGLLLALTIIAILGAGLENVVIAAGISGVPYYARLVRGQVLTIKQREYVEAARLIGVSDARLLGRHVLPNIVSPLIVLGSLGIGFTILSIAGLSFIGLGAQPPTPEWGTMLSQGRDFMRSQWWIATFPGLAIVVAVLGFNLLGDGLRDVLDPHSTA